MPPADVADFPTRTLNAGTRLYRIHRSDRACWHFSLTMNGRFDIAPEGSLYVAEAPLGSLLETARGTTLLSGTWRRQRSLSTLTLASPLRVADTTDPAAYEFGITNEVASIGTYDIPQAWARAFSDAGYDGVRYYARHDVASHEVSIALFGNDVVRAAIEASTAATEAIPDEVLAAAFPYGIRPAGDLPPAAEDDVRVRVTG